MLKVVHTSDWHLGGTLHEIDRHGEHQAFLDWLLIQLVEEMADVLLVSGDVFDSANPPAEALRILCSFLRSARDQDPHLQIILVGGNHDSALRLEAPRELFALANTQVIGAWPWTGKENFWNQERLCIPLKDRQGHVAAWLGAVPFLRPGDLFRLAQNEADNGEDGSSLTNAVEQIYANTVKVLHECCQSVDQALILTGHLYTTNGILSPDSERLIQRGNLESVKPNVFPTDVAYVALGHLHLAQVVDGLQHVRYSGSPLPLSFSETAYPHQVLSVTFEGKRCTETRPIVVPRFRELLRIPATGPGAKEDVLRLVEEFPCSYEEMGDRHRWPLVEARVRLQAPDPMLRKELEEALKNRAALLVRLEASFAVPDTTNGSPQPTPDPRLDSIDPEQVFLRKWHDSYSGEPSNAIKQAFLEILEAVQHGGEE